MDDRRELYQRVADLKVVQPSAMLLLPLIIVISFPSPRRTIFATPICGHGYGVLVVIIVIITNVETAVTTGIATLRKDSVPFNVAGVYSFCVEPDAARERELITYSKDITVSTGEGPQHLLCLFGKELASDEISIDELGSGSRSENVTAKSTKMRKHILRINHYYPRKHYRVINKSFMYGMGLRFDGLKE
ncbi:hypothetical protein Tco_1182000 [Tanacetum coccineum]